MEKLHDKIRKIATFDKDFELIEWVKVVEALFRVVEDSPEAALAEEAAEAGEK